MENKLPRLLNADEIEVRVGQVAKDQSWVSFLLYKDARCDMKRLDEMYGPMNWQRDHKELKGVMYCGVSVWDDEKKMFVTKWDAGTESNTEAQKGEASDSFKRACVNWGIGRELYSGPRIFINTTALSKGKDTRLVVKEIAYNDNREISRIVLADERTGNEVYSFGKKTTTTRKAAAADSQAAPTAQKEAPAEQQPTDEQPHVTTMTPQQKVKQFIIDTGCFRWFNEHGYSHAADVNQLTNIDLTRIYNTIKDGEKFKAWVNAKYKAA